MSNRGQIEAWDEHYDSGNIMLIPDIRVIRWASSLLRLDRVRMYGRALDLGCGNGRHSIALAKMGFRVLAVDYSPVAINAVKMWASIEQLSNDIEAFEVDLLKPSALTDLRETLDIEKVDLVLCWGLLEYFDDMTALRVLDEASYMSNHDARMLLMARGPKDFCYKSPGRSDGFMELHERDPEYWQALMMRQSDWGGEVELDQRTETFGNIIVGGVLGDKMEHMIFIEAERQ